MSTVAQKEFLTGFIHTLLDQTHTAEEEAVDLIAQITAQRCERLLVAMQVVVEELPEDGSTDTVWHTRTGVAVLTALGFEEPG